MCDIHPAAGEEYRDNLQWCRDHGVVVHSKPVNLFDYKHMLGSDDDFDLVIGFGLCFGTFCGANKVSRWKKTGDGLPREPPIRESSVEQRQYANLWNYWEGAKSVQHTFNEALMGQDLRTTHIIIHESQGVLATCRGKKDPRATFHDGDDGGDHDGDDGGDHDGDDGGDGQEGSRA